MNLYDVLNATTVADPATIQYTRLIPRDEYNGEHADLSLEMYEQVAPLIEDHGFVDSGKEINIHENKIPDEAFMASVMYTRYWLSLKRVLIHIGRIKVMRFGKVYVADTDDVQEMMS